MLNEVTKKTSFATLFCSTIDDADKPILTPPIGCELEILILTVTILDVKLHEIIKHPLVRTDGLLGSTVVIVPTA
jgi:hypothetical protein